MRHTLEKLAEALVGQSAAEEQRRLDRADRRVHGQSHLPVGQVRPQRRQQVHPLLDVVPLRPAQPAPLVLGQGAYLAVVDGERVTGAPVGLPCNSCPAPDTHAQMRRINLDGSGAEVVARGIRNTVGFDWHPVSKELYFTDNSRDWVSEDFPEDELNRITKVGEHFGAPYCLQGNIVDPEFGWGKSCADFTAPVGLLGPHSAALGMRFYTGKMLPAAYKNQIIMARHGSWNRTKKVGGDVLLVKLNKDGTVKSTEPLITGFVEDNKYIGRPVDVMQMKDGSLLVSDDWNGAVYRVTYGKQKLAIQ